MRIRNKILVALGLVMIILMGTLYIAVQAVMLKSVSETETMRSSSNISRFISNLNEAITSISNCVNDWANWDDSYRFIADKNTEFARSNLVDQTFVNLHVNAILFFDTSGSLVYGKMFDLQNHSEIRLSDSMLKEFLAYKSLFDANSTDKKTGLIQLGGMPMLIAASPILTSERAGPPHGTLIMARYLDQPELTLLSQSTGLPLSVFLANSPPSNQEQAVLAKLSKEHPVYSQTINDTSIAGYVLMNDVNDEPFLVVRMDDYRVEYATGVTNLTYAGASLVGICIILFFALAFLLNKIVISRLSDLTDTVINIRKTGDNSKRVKVEGEDELSHLSENINGMLDVIDAHTVSLETTVKDRTKDLMENQQKLASILRASPDAILAMDLEGVITECNYQVAKLAGCRRKDLIGRNAVTFIAHNFYPSFLKNMYPLISQQTGPIRFESRFLKADGTEYPAEFSANSIKDENGKAVGYVAIVRDLSEKKQMEQQLLKSQRLVAIGELAGMVGHDIRNPLAAIRNAHYYIKKKCRGCMKKEIPPMLEIIDKSIDHADSIVNDLLEYSKDLKLDLVERSPKELLEKALKLIKAPHNVRVFDSTTDTKLKVDEKKALRVFVNLIKNAFDAMPQGGTLEVKSALDEQGQVAIKFSDTGIGIQPDMLPKVFTPLFTTKAQGMGFGLAISKRIVEAHGGHISVKSEVEKGTTFTVVLPTEPTNHDVVNDGLTADF